VRTRALALLAALVAANAGVWVWALLSFRDHPVLLGTAFLAYSLGLRHALDADHIAAIDNAARKLMQEGQRPVGIGLYFSLGHSTVVIAASIGVAGFASTFKLQLAALHALGGLIGTLVSAAFLVLIASFNLFVLLGIYRKFRAVRRAGSNPPQPPEDSSRATGLLARLFRPLFGVIGRSWHMYPLGLLFGLGFDTATEVGLLGISAAEASGGMSIWSILVFPALFTAGMSLLDFIDGILMLGAYGWALSRPVRKLYYNLTITMCSVIVAFMVAGIETLALVREHLGLRGEIWDAIAALNENFGALGYVIVGVFALGWIVSLAIYRIKGYAALDGRGAAP
jgi:high-affinity nickel-transport protein